MDAAKGIVSRVAPTRTGVSDRAEKRSAAAEEFLAEEFLATQAIVDARKILTARRRGRELGEVVGVPWSREASLKSSSRRLAMRTRVILAVTAAVLLGADAPKERPADKDQDALQGKWRSTSVTRNGEKLDGAKHWTVLVVDKDRISWEANTLKEGGGETAFVPFNYKLDPSKDPKIIDLTSDKYATKGKGIYRLQEDELTVCVSWRDKARPTKFESEKGSGHELVTLKRVKK